MKETRALPHRRDLRGDGRPRNHSLPTVCGGYIALRSEEHTSELQSPCNVVCRLLLEKKTNILRDGQVDEQAHRVPLVRGEVLRLVPRAARERLIRLRRRLVHLFGSPSELRGNRFGSE